MQHACRLYFHSTKNSFTASPMSNNIMSRRQQKEQNQTYVDEKEVKQTTMTTGSGKVGLNDLPDDMLSLMLSLLNHKESCRARLVSRSWRHLWLPPFHHMNLDSELFFDCDHRALNKKGTSYSYNEVVNLQGQFVHKVEKYLASEPSMLPTLLSFKVSFFLGKEHASHVERWIKYALRKECESIELDFTFHKEGPPRLECKLFEFPCRLLALGEDSMLRSLCLKECNLRPSLEEASGFNYLKSLELVDVNLKQSVTDIIVSSCLNLERLKLACCSKNPREHMSTLIICDGQLPCLKRLRVHRCLGLKEIKISSASLQTFEFEGTDTTLKFSNVPMLTDVSVNFCRVCQDQWRYIFDSQLAGDVPNLQNLSLTKLINEVDHIPVQETTFNCLKQLVIQLTAPSDFDLITITNVLKASPILEKFKISMRDIHWATDFNHVIRRKKRTKRHGQRYSHLKEVELRGFCEKWNAFDFAKHLLQTAVALERMVIHIDKSCPWSNKREFSQHELGCLNASSKPELIVM